ncbi:MAG: hypothetical protein DI626_08420 [Micavibrio aeruginosavorus]|uniref:Uncharacterized protein n=1 Tax=Micavibrio aeruginosavorus TaxID=349221 RepID=A0A2W5BM06_9BACT|nr:MAG: hypothetical protein DI626_08420 [Micavibrio aeruginosavorus]
MRRARNTKRFKVITQAEVMLFCLCFSMPASAQDARNWDVEYVASCTHLSNPPELSIPEEYQAKLCACYFKDVQEHYEWGTLTPADLDHGLQELNARKATLRIAQEKPKPFTGAFDNIEFSKAIAKLALEGVLPLTKRPEIVQCLNDAHKNAPAKNPAGASE